MRTTPKNETTTLIRDLYISDTFIKDGITRKVIKILSIGNSNITGKDTYIISKSGKQTYHDYFKGSDEVTQIWE